MVPAINKLPSWDQMSEDILLVRSADNKTQHWALRIRFEQPYHGTYRDCYIDAYDGEYVREA
jgi:hypothetical protein